MERLDFHGSFSIGNASHYALDDEKRSPENSIRETESKSSSNGIIS